MQKIEFKGSNAPALSSWLKKFAWNKGTSDDSFLFEIDTKEGTFIGKNWTPDKSFVKMSTISFEDLGFTMLAKPIDSRVKIGLYDISKLLKVLAQFSDEDFDFILKYDKIVDDKGDQEDLAGLQILLKSSVLKIGLECCSLSIFEYISDQKFKNAIANIHECNASFDLKREDKDRILVLSDLDKDFMKLSFQIQDSKIFIKSKTFELELAISENKNLKELDFPILNKQFAKLDTEDHQVKIGDNRMILQSTDSNTLIVMGMLNVDTYESDKYLDLN